MNHSQYAKSTYKAELEGMVKTAESLRNDPTQPQDVSLADIFAEKTSTEKDPDGLGMDKLYDDLGIDPSFDSIANLFNMPDAAPRWVVPEIIRDSINLGLRKSPIYPNIIAAEQTLSGLEATVPYLNMSDAAPRWVGERETITFGNISYGSKTFKIRKMGRGITISDEVKNYVSLNVVAIFLRDFGVKLGYALDTLAVDVLLNGEQADGSESAPVIGVETSGTLAYKDLLTLWVRLSRLGRKATTMIAGEKMAIDILDMDEFKVKTAGTTQSTLNVKTPIPSSADLYIHGSIPDDQVVILDPATTMMKFNARPLLVESERIVSNQTENTFATLTTGFATMFKDSRMVLDQSVDIDVQGFPSYMNIDVMEVEEIK